MASIQQQSTPFPQIQPTQSNFTGAASAAIPGFGANSSAAGGIVNNLMTGKPALDRDAAAFFGVSAGVPGSDFARNRGYDMYRRDTEQRQQRGFDDFLNMLKTYSGTVMPTTGEALESNLGVQRLGQDRAQRENDLALQAAQLEMKSEQFRPREFSRSTQAVGPGGSPMGPRNFSYQNFR